MKKLLLVFPGYCIGLGGLLLITYRTFLAAVSGSKTITLQVNRYGEQYLDVLILCFLWVTCAIGLRSLSQLIRKQEDTTTQTEAMGAMPQQSDHSFFMNNGPSSPLISLRSSPLAAQGYQLLDEGDVSTSSVSLRVFQENLSEAL